MKKTILLIFISFFILNTSNKIYGQGKKNEKFGTIYKKNGSIVTGDVKNFYTSPTFKKIPPFILFENLFKKNRTNYFGSGVAHKASKDVKIKPKGSNDFQKIEFDSISKIVMTNVDRDGEVKSTEFIAIEGKGFYGKKRDKITKAFLPEIKKGEAINLYGTVHPIRRGEWLGPIFIEYNTPLPYENLMIENIEKKLIIGESYIELEKSYTTKQVKKRAKHKDKLNHNSLYELFGDCPETKALIDKFYIKRIQDPTTRKQLAIEYNKKLKKNVKNYHDIIRKDRNKATPELYMQLYEFDLLEIINTYEKNCLPIDEFDPKHESYKKEFDLINKDKKEDTL